MAGFRDREKQHFPLTNIQSVVDLFTDQLEREDDVDLALLSIVLGCIENTLTMNRSVQSGVDESKTINPIFPVVEAETIETLYAKFTALIKGNVDLTKFETKYATRELVKRVSDVIWGSLTRAYYKDKAHLQSLFSFLTGNKLDCFGVAFAVVAACQVLGFKDVKLSLSEDHAWVCFGEDNLDTAEVTWHGKGNEDKRGQPITEAVTDKAWLYLNGQPVVCTRRMEVAAMVSSINPAISATIDSVEMGALQQELLYLIYSKGHLARYPMAIGNLGDLEEISPVSGHPTPVQLFQEAIAVARTHYNNQHVYPYTYLGQYMYRHKRFPEAIHAWAQAASVIKGYNYTREDEEVYKEFLEIANEFIPNIAKAASKEDDGDPPLLQNPDVYADLLRFYDGICQWEEGSSTPVLHVGWAQQFTFTLSKFDPRVRSLLDIEANSEDEQDEDSCDKGGKVNDKDGHEMEHDRRSSSVNDGGSQKTRRGRKRSQAAAEMKANDGKDKAGGEKEDKVKRKEAQIKSAMEELVSKGAAGLEQQDDDGSPNHNIAALAQACSSSILNKDFLLTGGEPFASSTAGQSLCSAPSSSSVPSSTAGAFSAKDMDDFDEFLSTKSNGTSFIGLSLDSMLKAESPADMMLCGKRSDAVHPVSSESSCDLFSMREHVALELHSEKMKGLKKILVSTKLNANAIKLQLTAQSQVHPKHAKRGSEADSSIGSLRKRSRRE